MAYDKKIFVSRLACGLCGLIPTGDSVNDNAWKIGRQLALCRTSVSDTPVTPDEPVVTSTYLYGSPAPNVVTYSGVYFPDIESVWTDELKELYPYAIVYGTTTLYLRLSSVPFTWLNETYIYAENFSSIGYALRTKYAKWRAEAAFCNVSGQRTFRIDQLVWTSHDILYEDGTVFLAASEQPVLTTTRLSASIGVRVGDSVTYYDGLVADILPEYDDSVYPHVYISYRDYSDYICMFAFPIPMVSAYSTSLESPNEEAVPYISASLSSTDTGAWNAISESTWSVTLIPPLWSNTDFYFNDNLPTAGGLLCLKGTDPIPVGEIVEYIDDIPIYEGL